MARLRIEFHDTQGNSSASITEDVGTFARLLAWEMDNLKPGEHVAISRLTTGGDVLRFADGPIDWRAFALELLEASKEEPEAEDGSDELQEAYE